MGKETAEILDLRDKLLQEYQPAFEKLNRLRASFKVKQTPGGQVPQTAATCNMCGARKHVRKCMVRSSAKNREKHTKQMVTGGTCYCALLARYLASAKCLQAYLLKCTLDLT